MVWEVDPVHSQVTFSVRHMMISTVRGHFEVLSGKLELDEQHPENSWVAAQVETASINTRDPKRDAHLRSPDFFDADKYPVITFKSHKIEPVGANQYRVTGDLTMHGVTRPTTFHAEYSGQMKDPFGLQRAAFAVKGKINRKDFGLNWNVALEAGGIMVGEDVNIEIDLEVTQKVETLQTQAQTV